jgi:hypothetical protein
VTCLDHAITIKGARKKLHNAEQADVVEGELRALMRGTTSADLVAMNHLVSKAAQNPEVDADILQSARNRATGLAHELEIQLQLRQRNRLGLEAALLQASHYGAASPDLMAAGRSHVEALQAEKALEASTHGSCPDHLQSGICVAAATRGICSEKLGRALRRHRSLNAERVLRTVVTTSRHDHVAVKDAIAGGINNEDYNPALHVLLAEAKRCDEAMECSKTMRTALEADHTPGLDQALTRAASQELGGAGYMDEGLLHSARTRVKSLKVDEALAAAAWGGDLSTLDVAMDRARRHDHSAHKVGDAGVSSSTWSSAHRHRLELEFHRALNSHYSVDVQDCVNRAVHHPDFNQDLLHRGQAHVEALTSRDTARRLCTTLVA